MMQELIDKYAWVLGVLALFGFELAPIKFNPISWIGSLLGKVLGISKINDRLDVLEKNMNSKINDRLDVLEKNMNSNELDRIKYEILQFSGSLRNGLNRTETDYRHIEAIFTKYKGMGGNTYIMHEMEYIRDCHDKGRIM